MTRCTMHIKEFACTALRGRRALRLGHRYGKAPLITSSQKASFPNLHTIGRTFDFAATISIPTKARTFMFPTRLLSATIGSQLIWQHGASGRPRQHQFTSETGYAAAL